MIFGLGIAKTVFGYFPTKTKNYVNDRLENKRNNKKSKIKEVIRLFHIVSFIICGLVFCLNAYALEESYGLKSNITKNGSDLTKVNSEQIAEVEKVLADVDKINNEKLKVVDSLVSGEVFHIKNDISNIKEQMINHKKKSIEFNDRYLQTSVLTVPAL